MGNGRRRLIHNLWGSVGVVAVVALVGLGLPALNRRVPAVQPVPAGRPYDVGAGVSVVPPGGTSVDATQTRPGPINGQVLFFVGSIRYAVVVSPFTGSLDQATSRLRAKITATRGYQVTGPESRIVTRQGVTGRQGLYSSSGRDGRYVVFLRHGVDVEITAAASDVDLRPLLPAIEASILTVSFGGSAS
jgi:hypothetical protein